ncbi:monomethylamine permease [Methanosarcina sp. T3]|uniref:monomethylamine permease n=1 Tax=Methanosarcina sp. T3 TaxID=3439062 RepID=UPI003F853B01
METNKQAMESKYQSKLNGDTVLVVGMLALLVGVEGFVIYKIFAETWEIVSGFSYLYVIFLGLIVSIETIGCLRVRKSIKNHMFEFKYYD